MRCQSTQPHASPGNDWLADSPVCYSKQGTMRKLRKIVMGLDGLEKSANATLLLRWALYRKSEAAAWLKHATDLSKHFVDNDTFDTGLLAIVTGA